MLFGDSRAGPPPLRPLTSAEMWHKIWGGEGSVVLSLFKGMAVHAEKEWVAARYADVQQHDPGHSQQGLKKSLLW